MKKLLFVFAIVLGISTVSNAQSNPNSSKNEKAKMGMKDGVMVVDSKAILCSKEKCTPLTETYSCSDGCKVSPDGTITKPDGTKMKLENGYRIDKEGKVEMIAHGQKGHMCGTTCSMHKQM